MTKVRPLHIIATEAQNKSTTEGGNTMAEAKRYTAEQLRDAEKMAATLANVPEEKRTLVIMMTNSFMAGMEAQKAIDDTAKAVALA